MDSDHIEHAESSAAASAQAWLDDLIRRAGAIAGTVHVDADGDLSLMAHRNIPEPVLRRVQHVPRGKGMAGLAQVRAEPVQTCNLQTDSSGHINPMAKLVDGQAAVALPVLDARGRVCAVVGLAFAASGEVPAEIVTSLMQSAATLPMIGPRAHGA